MSATPRVLAAVVAALAALALATAAAPAVAAGPTPTPRATTGATSSPTSTAGPKAAAKPAVVTFGVQPARKGKPDARPYYNYGVTPGGVLHDQAAIRNFSTKPLTLRVYATDAVNLQDGGFGLLPSAQRPVEAGSWIAVGTRDGRGFVTVPARQSVVVPIRLTVPRDATPGDHVGGIVVSLTTRSTNTDGAAVELDQRVGSRVFIRVSGPLHPALSIEQVRASYDGVLNPFGSGRASVSYVVRNTGNVKLGGRQQVSVHGPAGPTAQASGLADVPLLLPGGSYRAIARVQGVWPLARETATVRVAPLVVPGDVVPGLHESVATATFWALPWTPLAILVGLVLLLGGGLVLRRWRGRPGRTTGAATTPIPSASLGATTPALGTSVGPTVRRLLVAAGVAPLVLVALSSPAEPAYAEGAPYVDPGAVGRITLCDAANRPVTTGSVSARPFVALAVGEAPAAPGYGGPGRVANLLAFQPREGIFPGEWSGLGMTANTRYSNAAHPMARTVPTDYSLSDYLQAYPTRWRGMVQLRIYLRAPNQPTYRLTYNALDLRVVGNTWTVVAAPGAASCTAGKAVSVATILGVGGTAAPTTSGGTPAATAGARPSSAQPSSPLSKAGATTPPPDGSDGSDGSDGASQPLGAAETTGNTSSLGPWALGAVTAVLALLGLAAAALRRRPRGADAEQNPG